jgi:hypothetical protein
VTGAYIVTRHIYEMSSRMKEHINSPIAFGEREVLHLDFGECSWTTKGSMKTKKDLCDNDVSPIPAKPVGYQDLKQTPDAFKRPYVHTFLSLSQLRLLRRLAFSLLLQSTRKKTSIINKGLCRSIVSASHQFSPDKCNSDSLPVNRTGIRLQNEAAARMTFCTPA